MSVITSVSVRRVALTAAALTSAAAIAATSFASSASTTAAGRPSTVKPAQGQVNFVQAVPQTDLTIAIDGKQVKSDVTEGSIVGPLALGAGTHQVDFTSNGTTISSTVQVTDGKMTDVVVHRPSAVGGTPVVSVYPTPNGALGPGKARVLLAHTATTAPADVQVDGKTVFTNIANGEYAEADLSAGSHQIALFPAGVSSGAILGPITVDLKPGTLTAVYAVGNPKDMSMNVITRTSTVTSSDTTAPSSIDTGSAGLADGVRVDTFTAR